MNLELERTYYPEGTNGDLYLKSEGLCHTIELPWKENLPGLSCIPEGKYLLTRRYSAKYGWHLLVNNVVNRFVIVVYPANDAPKELRGCIAPVGLLIGADKGTKSKFVFEKLKRLEYASLDKIETVLLNITAADPGKGKLLWCKSLKHEYHTKGGCAHSPIF